MKNLTKLTVVVLAILLFCVAASPAFAEKNAQREKTERSISFSPMMLVTIISIPENLDSPLDSLWFGIDVNSLKPENKELSFGVYVTPVSVGLRTQRRTFARDDHRGFLYGLYGRLEYQHLYWGYTDTGAMQVQAIWGNDKGDHSYHSVGVTFGGDIGYRWRGKTAGVTLYIGAGLPLFYSFGDLPAKKDMDIFYGTNVLQRLFEAGLKIDFY